MRLYRASFIFILSVLCAGCQTAPSVWTPEHLTQDDAIIVHGLKATSAKTIILQTWWHKFSQEKYERDKGYRADSNYGFFNLLSADWPDKNIGTMNYAVSRVKSGEYILGWINHSKKGGTILPAPEGPFLSVAKVLYKGTADKSLFAEKLFTGRETSGMDYSFVFKVSPGEVIYIGDLFVDASDFPVRSVRMENNLETARNISHLHPSFRPLLKFRKPRDLSATN